MKQILSLGFLIFFSVALFGQTTSPTAIVSAGNAVTVQGTYVSWSVGETFVTTLTSPSLILTQGFQQPDIIISGCTNSLACNYNAAATQDDGSCILPVTPSVVISSSDADNSICSGTSVTFTATPTNGGTTPTYQWKLNGANVGTNSATYTNAALTTGAVVTVVMTANNTCQSTPTANGNSITTTVLNNVTPAVAVTSSDADNSICSGTSVTFTATPTNGGTTPSYQWKLNGANVVTNSATYTNAALTTGAVVTVVMTANNTCQSTPTANGNSITTTVLNNVTPAVAVTSSDADNSICSGTSVTFTVTPTNGGTTPTYQWKLNGANVGTNSVTYTNAALTTGAVVTVVMAANNACQSTPTATSTGITTTVNPSVTPAVAIASSDADNSICAGTSVTFTATPTNGGTTPTYQWLLNGANVGTGGTTFTSSALTTGAVVTVVMTANNTCQTTPTATSNAITTTVSTNAAPAVAVTSSDADNSICSGTSVTFTATPTNGGSTPAYQWKLNGGNVGTNSSTYTNAALTTGAVVTVVMTANNTCQSTPTANGNSITTTVLNSVTPSVAITSSDADNNICSGTSVTFTATPTNGGTTPTYQWKLNGTNVGTNSSTYTNAALTTGAIVTVVMTANNTCQSTPTANGNNITTVVTTPSTWYLDADADGYYVSTQTACVNPGAGYTSTAGIQGDCNDNAAAINAGATDICGNGIDEDCSGSDCLIVLGCIDSTACNFDPLANSDNGSCILPQLELCNGLDDNCNGQIDEGLTLGSVNAVSVTTSMYPTCSGNALKSANLNNGTNSAIIDGTGMDLWYSLNAEYNTLRTSLSAAFGDNEIRLYRYTNGCFDLIDTEHEVYTTTSLATGNQILITDNLIPGQTYYVAVHNVSGNMNSSAKVCFNHFVGTTCDHYYGINGTGVYANVCSQFKAQFKGNATNYIFDVLSATQNNTDLNITPWNYTTPSSSSIITRLGTLLPANMTASPKVYSLQIPVVYAVSDAAGNYTSITADATTSCTVTLNAETAIELRTSDRCPVTKTVSASIGVNRTICGALRYEWEFTQQLPTVQSSVTVLGGLNSSVLFLNNVPGMGTGKTYNVRVRPIHANGEIGNWGTAQCLKTGTSGMILDPNSALTNSLINQSADSPITLYPNPTSGDHFTLTANGSIEENEVLQFMVTDITGKLVMKNQIVWSGSQVEIPCGDLADGVYMVMVGDQRIRMVVSK